MGDAGLTSEAGAMTVWSQLTRLSKPFPPALIKQPPKGKYGSYVSHDVVNQKLLALLGPIDFEVVELVRGAEGKVEACLARMTCDIDGRKTTVVEVGDCESPDNWKTEGARMKDAASDAFKRCAMRLGVGLHLWSGQDYFLYDQLLKQSDEQPAQPRRRIDTPDATALYAEEDDTRPVVEVGE